MPKVRHKLIGPVKQLLTMQGLPAKGAISDSMMHVVENSGLLLNGSLIKEVGPFSELWTQAVNLEAEIIHLEEEYVCLPGMIDCHTHICFGGSRAWDYARRNAGMTYLEIAKAGGGIWDTVIQTRKSTLEELQNGILNRARKHLVEGVTTVEVKSGYGLSVPEELKILRAIKKANESEAVDLISTCLAAHTLPKNYKGNPEDYLNEMSTRLLPQVLREGLAKRVDIFIEEEAFNAEVSKPYLKQARLMGFDLVIHADQFHAAGSKVAVELGALSADHLEASGKDEIVTLAKSRVIATVLPGASLGLGVPYAPARKLLDAGVAVAIASDWNPGSAPMGNLLTQAAILGASQKLTNAEVLAGVTFRAANALRLSDRGRLEKGMLGDFILFPCQHYNEILYHQGQLKPAMIFKHGIKCEYF